MARAIAGAVVLGTAVAACFSAPTRPGDGTGDSGVTGDGTLVDSLSVDAMLNVDGNPSNCVSDDFVGSGSGSCGQFLTMTNNLGMASFSGTTTGELKLNVAGSGAFVNCTSANNTWNRVTIETIDPASSATNHTFLGLQSADGQSRWGIDIKDNSGSASLTTVCDGNATTVQAVPWNILQHRYIMVERNASAITVSASGNNMAFEPLTDCATTADLTSTQAQVRAYTLSPGSGAATSPDVATFGSIELCHP